MHWPSASINSLYEGRSIVQTWGHQVTGHGMLPISRRGQVLGSLLFVLVLHAGLAPNCSMGYMGSGHISIIQQKQMNRYPITIENLDKDAWTRKVNATLMMSFQAQEETLPYLEEFVEILDRVNTLPLEQTLVGQEVIAFFFEQCFPAVCQKLINSKYFRNDTVLQLSNRILEVSVSLFLKYMDLIPGFPKFAETLTIVFQPDVQYFKHNNQLDYKPYPWLYYGNIQDNSFLNDLKVGDLIDAIKYESTTKKATWSRAHITEMNQDYITVRYLNDLRLAQKDIVRDSVEIAPLGTMSKDFDWRMDLKEGDTLDCCDNYGGWYSGTVIKSKKKQNGKTVKVGLKLFDPAGDKIQKGQPGQPYFGLSDAYDSDDIDVTSPQIQPLQTVARYKQYSFSKSHSDFINDYNDHVMEYLKGERLYVVPRNKFCSQTLFRISKNFIKQGGFDKLLQLLQDKINPDLLTHFLTPLGQISPMLHKMYVKELVEKIKPIVERHLIDESEATIKSFTKDKSQAIFQAMKNLLKRIESTQQSKQYEVSTKLELANLCLKSQSLKRRLQGLSQIKDILKSVRSHLPQKVNAIGKWLRDHAVFEKIYVQNSHAQLIKKSTQYFKFLVVENLLQVNELQLIYKAAQRGDFEARVSVYKLFEQVSHNFKKPHVDYLIDQILESEIGLVATEDLDLLLELSKYSNYFPLQKVVAFLEKILFAENPNPQLLEVAIKRYSQMVVKNSQMIRCREQNIKMLAEKLLTDKVQVSCRVLTAILENVGSGQFGRYEILEHINKAKIDSTILETIKKNKDSPKYMTILQKLLNLLAMAVQNSQRIKLNIDTFIKFWEQLVKNNKNPKQKEVYYKWCSAVTKVEHVFSEDNQNKLQEFFLKLTSPEQISSLNEASFDAISIMFVSINLKCHNISQSNVWKNGKEEKVLRLLVLLNHLKFYDSLLALIYNVQNPKVAQSALEFYSSLYSTQQLSSKDRQQYIQRISQDFFRFYNSKEYQKIPRVLRLLDLIIDESEKGGPVVFKSLAMFKKGEQYTIDVLNENAYMGDSNKSFQVKIDSNNTLLQLRKLIAKQMSSTWQEVKLHQKQEIPDLYNGRLIKDCPIKFNQSIKANKRNTLQPQEDLLINNKLSPKAIKAFESIFKRFSTNGLMSKDQCQKFTMVCLGQAAAKTYDQRIASVYEKYDDDRDNFLTLQNFLNFYEDASKQRPNTVWGNLRSCRIRYDFKSMDDPDSDMLEIEALPRYELSLNNAFYEGLFDLLKEDQSIAKPCWKMLQKMPVSTHLYQQLLNSTNYQILNLQNPYKTLYCLYIFEHLLENEQREEKEIEWRERFIREEGYQKLFKLYTKLFESDENMKQVEIQISQFILDLISEFIVTVFKTDQSIKSHEILRSNIDFDELVAYISAHHLPTDKNKLSKFTPIIHAEEKYSKFKDHEWKGVSEKEMTSCMIDSIRKLWKHKMNGKIRDRMLEDCLSILLTLILHHKDSSSFLSIVPELISKSPSHVLLIKLYLLLACLCFYGKIDQQPVINTLLNFLKYSENSKNTTPSDVQKSNTKKQENKSTFISEQYFMILVVLIEWFGLTNMSQQTIDILLRNVLTNQDQQIVQASALVLARLKLQTVSVDILKQIWTNCLFSNNISCKKPETRFAVYKLVLSIGSYNSAFINQLTNLIISTLSPCVNQLKSMSELELKSRCIYNYAGLRNLGAVCYMLAMLQQFYMNPTFRYLMLRVDDKKEPNLAVHNNREYDDNLLHQIQKLFAFLEGTQRGDYNPIEFCYSFKDFNGDPINVCVQQDTQEFVFMLLDRLQAALNPTPFKYIISNMYKGKQANLFTCSKCNNTKVREQDFFCLTLQVKNSKNLSESFDKFINGEVINDYTCDFCSQKADVSKRTLISKLPRVLIFHLQRIVFSLDTFVNEKISTKLEFPFEIDMAPYLFEPFQTKDSANTQKKDKGEQSTEKAQEHTQKSEDTQTKTSAVQQQSRQSRSGEDQKTEATQQKKPVKNKNIYDLVGVVAHNGGAEYGHYYSYIKTDNGQWLDFNDSTVKIFDLKNSEQEWFGGTTEAVDEQFDWTVKKQNSRSAYLLIYQQRQYTPIQLAYTDVKEKNNLLEQLKLKEENEVTEVTEEDILRLEEQQLPMSTRKFSKQQIIKDEEKKQQTLNIQEPIEPYISEYFTKKIAQDNLLHQFQINICSSFFIKFYTKFLELDLPKQKLTEIIQLTLKLALGIWLKQPSLKQLLPALEKAIKRQPDAGEIIISNETVVNMLLQSSDNDIRNCMESLLLTAVGGLIQKNQLPLTKENELDTKVVDFLDHLFSLIPTTVSKNWMKFSQYFGFWKGFSVQGASQGEFMINRQMISHLLDYFLDKKSPLGIYSKKKHQIGNKSSSINPNFTSLLDTVSNLVNIAMSFSPKKLTQNDKKILMSFDFLDKMFSENSTFGANLVKSMCFASLAASQKVAIVLIKGFSRCTYENIQPFLDVTQSYLLINDGLRKFRIKWVIGAPRLVLSPVDKSIACLNTHSFDERLYVYDSTIQFDQTQSILEGLFKNMTRMLNYCMLTLKCLLSLCIQNEDIKEYVWNLPPPIITYGHYHDFFEQFIDSYIKEGIKVAYSSFPKVDLGNSVLEIYNKIINKDKKVIEEQKPQEKVEKQQEEEDSCDSVKGLDNNSENKEDHSSDWALDNDNAENQIDQDIRAHPYTGMFHGSKEEYGITDSDLQNEQQGLNRERDAVLPEDIDMDDRYMYGYPHPIQREFTAQGDINVEAELNVQSPSNIQISGVSIPLQFQTSDSDAQMEKQWSFQDQSKGEQHKEPQEVKQERKEQVQKSEDKPEKPEQKVVKQNQEQIPQQIEEPGSIYHPVQFKYHEESVQSKKGLLIHHHNSDLVFIKTSPTLNKNDTFLNLNRKLIDRIPKQAWETSKTKPYRGVFIQNTSKQSLRFQWEYGTGYLKSGESTFVDTSQIIRVWHYEKEEWPKWSLYC